MEDGNLANLITGGLSFALMSADSSAKAARAVQERVRMGFAAAEDSGAVASTGQKGAAAELGLKISARERYSAMAFRDRVSRMRMDLRG